ESYRPAHIAHALHHLCFGRNGQQVTDSTGHCRNSQYARRQTRMYPGLLAGFRPSPNAFDRPETGHYSQSPRSKAPPLCPYHRTHPIWRTKSYMDLIIRRFAQENRDRATVPRSPPMCKITHTIITPVVRAAAHAGSPLTAIGMPTIKPTIRDDTSNRFHATPKTGRMRLGLRHWNRA